MTKKQANFFGNLGGAAVDWSKRKAFDFAPQHFAGKRGGEIGSQFGSLFGMDDKGEALGQQAGRFGGSLYKGLPKGQKDFAYNTMNTVQPMVQQGLDALTQFGGGMQDKTSAEKQALDPTLGLAPLLGALAGGVHGAYKAPKGSRPEGFGRGMYRGGGAGAGAVGGGLAGGLGGGILGAAISRAVGGPSQGMGDKRYLPILLALLGGGAGAYGGGKLGWRVASGVTGDNAKLDKEEEEKEASMEKQSIAAIVRALSAAKAIPKAFGAGRKALQIANKADDGLSGAGKLKNFFKGNLKGVRRPASPITRGSAGFGSTIGDAWRAGHLTRSGTSFLPGLGPYGANSSQARKILDKLRRGTPRGYAPTFGQTVSGLGSGLRRGIGPAAAGMGRGMGKVLNHRWTMPAMAGYVAGDYMGVNKGKTDNSVDPAVPPGTTPGMPPFRTGVTSDNIETDVAGEEKGAAMDKQASLAAILAALGGGAAGGYGGGKGVIALIKQLINKGTQGMLKPNAGMAMMLPGAVGATAAGAVGGAGLGALGGYGGAKGIEALLGKESAYDKSDLQRVKLATEKQAFLPQALGGIGKGLGHLLGGAGKLGYRGLMRGLGVGKGVAPTSALTKGLTLGAGGLGLSAINEVLSSTKGGPIQLPHLGMGGDQPWWDPMMQHDRIDPKKTSHKAYLNMATRPLQTLAVLTGMAKKPSALSDYARFTDGNGSRVTDSVSNPRNYNFDPNTGDGSVTGEQAININPVMIERMQDYARNKAFMENIGLQRRDGSSSSYSRRRRGRFD